MGEEIKPEVLEAPDVAQQEQQPLEEKTVVEEVVEKAGDAVEEVRDVVENVVEEVKETVEEVKEAVVNYGEKTLAELSSLFQELTEKADRMKRSKEAEAIKSAFYKKLSREKAAAGLDGNVEEPDEAVAEVPSVEVPSVEEPAPTEEVAAEPAPAEDVPAESAPEGTAPAESGIENPFAAIEEGFKALYTKYKKERAEYNRQQDAEREDNLAKKLAVIEDLKALTESQGDMKDLFPQFREIQDRWRAIGPVPAQNFRDVNDTYQHSVEQFYDLVQINRELRDLDFKKNLEVKEQFCEQAEELCNSEDVVGAFKELQKLHEQWKEYGPVAKEYRDSIWDRFKAATAVINKRYQAHFEGQKEKQQENLEEKTKLCEQVEAIAEKEVKSSGEWNQLSSQIEEIQKKWRTIGFATKKENQKIYDRFRAACDKFFSRKREYYSQFKDSMNENMEKKLSIIERVEALKDSKEWKKTTEAIIALQKEWKEIGAVPRKKSEQLWKRFRAACDEFFAERDKNSKPENDYYGNLRVKKALIDEINAYEPKDAEADQAAAREFAERWRNIGFVPYKEKESIQKAYSEAVQAKFPDYSPRPARSAARGAAPARKPVSEKDRLVQEYNKLQQDIVTYENNIGFFSASKNSEPLIKQMQDRIEAAKQELKELEAKILKAQEGEEEK